MTAPPDFVIAGRAVGASSPPFVIAEMSGNHNHSLERALAIVEAAATAGAHALKIQTYTADTLTLDTDAPGFTIDDPKSLWAGRRLHDLYDEAHTPWEWHEPIFTRARELGMIPFSSPFDLTAVQFLEALDAPCYKIASFEITHHPLIRAAAETGKPLIMSTGMATEDEIRAAVSTARDAGCDDILLLKCTSNYPASPANSNLQTIPDMRNRFGCAVGLSDHTLGVGVSVAAVAFGAVAIEKHFTLDRDEGGVDSAFSLEPDELRQLIIETGRAWEAIGAVSYGPSDDEKRSLRFRQSLYVGQDMRAGDIFTEENLRVVRPGFGLSPAFYDEVLGRSITRDASIGTPLDESLYE